MRQVLAIFRKDVRALWPQLAAALTLTALTGWADVPAASTLMISLVDVVWAACWIYLAAWVIQQERLPGDRQYWLTRPYDWRLLLTAKALFVAVFAMLPLIAVGAAMLAAHGISPLGHVSAVLWSSLVFGGAFVLPAGALAAVTETLAQFLWGLLAMAMIAAAAITFGENYAGDWGPVAWVRAVAACASIAAGAAAVLWLQYRLRRSLVSRGILLVTALLVALAPFGRAWHGAWRVESSRQPVMGALQLSFDAANRPRMRYADARLFPANGYEGIYLPIRVGGLPAGLGMVSQRVAAAIEGAGGSRWDSGWQTTGALLGADPLTDVRFLQADGAAWIYLDVDRAFYQAARDTAARVRISVAVTLLAKSGTGTVKGTGRTGGLPLDGICEVRRGPTFAENVNVRGARNLRNLLVSCAWPQPGPDRAYVQSILPGGLEDAHAALADDAGALLPFDLSVWRRGWAGLSVRAAAPQLAIETWRAERYLELSLDIPGVRLSDYAAPRATDPQ